MVKVAGKQSLGKRDNQEDAFKLVFQDEKDPGSDVLMILADGMGGHAGGEVAANLASNVFSRHFVAHATARRPRARLEQSLHAANTAVADKIAQDPNLKGMGCTLIGALKIDDRLSWVSVGDSVLFLFRDGKLSRLNVDHSVYGELLQLVRDGSLSQAEADQHPKRNALRSAVTGKSISLVDLEAVDLKTGDLVVIATDGLETISDAAIADILKKEERPDVRAVCSDLLNAVEEMRKPNQDNTTVVVYRHAGNGRTLSTKSQWTSLGDELGTPRRAMASLPIIGGIAAIVLAVLATTLWIAFGPKSEPEVPPVGPAPDTQAEPAPSGPREKRLIEGSPPEVAEPQDETDIEQTPDSGIEDEQTDPNIDSESDQSIDGSGLETPPANPEDNTEDLVTPDPDTSVDE